MDVGFVGVGNMGRLMAPHIMAAGHRVIVFDASEAAREEMGRAGAIVADSSRAVAEVAEMVVSSLPTPASVEDVYLGPGGLIEGAKAGQVFADLSSITPSVARKVAEAFAEKGSIVLDAPVSGGTDGARDATLAIMVGGDEGAFQRIEPILRTMGKKIFHVGPVGAGSTVKILNQLMIGANNMMVSEMAALAERVGVSPSTLFEIIPTSSGHSKAFDTRFAKIAKRDFSRGFAVDLMAKDLRLGVEMARDAGMELRVAPFILGIYEEVSRAGHSVDDICAAFHLFHREKE
jgi:3-hydroxyisobutyrate dehydrogenase-like beta-hydroxyacid dehydrogenase